MNDAHIHRIIDRYMHSGSGSIGNSRYHERHAMVTSYDPDRFLAKVMIQPEGQETGWLPIETSHIGNDYGVAIGLQPGDGKSTGDQVIIRHQEGDLESAKIVQRVHSDNQKPPTVQSGEMVLWTKFRSTEGQSNLGDETTDGGAGGNQDEAQSGQGGYGAQIYFKNDGSVTTTDGNGATTQHDGNGNIVITCKKFTVNASSDIKLISAANALVKGAAAILYATANAFVKAASAVNVKGASTLVDPDWTNGASDPPISS